METISFSEKFGWQTSCVNLWMYKICDAWICACDCSCMLVSTCELYILKKKKKKMSLELNKFKKELNKVNKV